MYLTSGRIASARMSTVESLHVLQDRAPLKCFPGLARNTRASQGAGFPDEARSFDSEEDCEYHRETRASVAREMRTRSNALIFRDDFLARVAGSARPKPSAGNPSEDRKKA